jgi:ketosteroid isomerase-like protein
MSQENVEMLQRGCAALSRLDADALAEVCDPEIVFESRITETDGATYRGHDGTREFVAQLGDAFDWIDIELLEIIGDGDQLVATIRFRARGRRSAAEVQQTFFQAATFRNGRALWWSFFDSQGKAREAVGLTE